jgi:hypothetical protein
MARANESLGWGGSGLHGDAGIKLRKALDALEAVDTAAMTAKINELVDAVNTLNGDTAIDPLETEEA